MEKKRREVNTRMDLEPSTRVETVQGEVPLGRAEAVVELEMEPQWNLELSLNGERLELWDSRPIV